MSSKFPIRWTFDSPGPGDFKTLFFQDFYFLFYFDSSRSTVVKFAKHRTKKKEKKNIVWWQAKQPCILNIYIEYHSFLLPAQSMFLKNYSIFGFGVQLRVFWSVTRLYLKKCFFFLIYYRGSKTLKSKWERNLRLKKNTNPLANGSRMPTKI